MIFLTLFPLIILGVLLAYYYGINWLIALFASMALHCFKDLPLHNDDAHRHFFPLSDWRFKQPFILLGILTTTVI